MGKSDDKSQVLGDDPLAWLNAGSSADNKTDKKKASKKKVTKKARKVAKKAKPEKARAKKATPKKDIPKKEAKTETGLENASDQFVLESSLVINKASDVYESLKKFSENKQSIEIDASKVENIDSAILQLLVAFVLDLNNGDIKLSWYKPTEALKKKAAILGLTDSLGL